MRTYKQSDNSNDVIFYMVDSADHVTPKTGLTLTVKVKKNGAGFASGTGTTTEIEDGLYKYVPSVSEMGTLGPIHFKATSAGADNCVIEGVVVAYDPYNPYFGIAKINSLKDSWNDPTAAECKADLTTLESRLTAARAGYLDNLNVLGLVASAGGLTAVNSNLSTINSVTLPQIESKIDIIDGFVDGIVAELDTTPLATLAKPGDSMVAANMVSEPPSADSIATAVWNYATSLMVTAGSIGLKFKEWVVGKITSIDDTVDFTSVQKTSLNAATPSVTINDKTGFSLTSEYDPAKTAAQVSDTEAIQTVVEFIKDVNEGDCFIDQTTTPFQMVVHKKGDPTTEFIRKDLLDQNGDGITDLTTHTIYQREPS